MNADGGAQPILLCHRPRARDVQSSSKVISRLAAISTIRSNQIRGFKRASSLLLPFCGENAFRGKRGDTAMMNRMTRR